MRTFRRSRTSLSIENKRAFTGSINTRKKYKALKRKVTLKYVAC